VVGSVFAHMRSLFFLSVRRSGDIIPQNSLPDDDLNEELKGGDTSLNSG
jgi:hypothetical protein